MTRLGLPHFYRLLPCVALALAACSDDTSVTDTSTTETSGDGDPTGDGDGDPTGDGDGDPGDGDPDPVECAETQEQCIDGGHQLCVNGSWTDDPCPDGSYCDNNNPMCIPCVCTPGATGACVDGDNIEICNDACSGYDAAPCEDAICMDDMCVDLVCNPQQTTCTSNDTYQVCNGLGTEWGPDVECDPGQLCLGGDCIDACLYAETIKSNIGCEFWAVDMSTQPPRDTYTYAIAVANPDEDDTATVQIWDKRNGIQTAIIEDTVPPRETRVFNVSGSHGQYTSYYNGMDAGILLSGIAPGYAFRVVADIPVVATQFNPIGGATAIVAEASLLLPTHSLGSDYIHLAWGQGYGAGSALNVIATQNNTTVTITPHVDTPAGSNGLPAMTAGVPTDIVLNAYDYIQIGIQDQNMETDLQSMSGSFITSDAPVAVFGGHSCANIPDEAFPGCDHVEEQIFPRETWGNNFVAIRNPPRPTDPNEPEDMMRWRIIASVDNTVIDFEPNVALGAQVILDAGQMVEFDEVQDFYVSATEPIMMAGFMTGCTTVASPCRGDPYMVMMVPVEQYQDDYVFLVDDTYTQDYAKLVRPAGEEVTVECLGGPVPDDRWTAIGNSGWEWATIDINPGEAMCMPGTNQAYSNEGFGVVVSGQSSFASYAYPGGMSLQQINPL